MAISLTKISRSKATWDSGAVLNFKFPYPPFPKGGTSKPCEYRRHHLSSIHFNCP